MLRIEIKGKEYPCRLVMGALLMYKRESGEDVSEMKSDDMEKVLLLMWCCLKCSCQAEGVSFDYDFESFCNLITPDDVSAWNSSIGEEKKKEEP